MIGSTRALIVLVILALAGVIGAWLVPAARSPVDTVDRRIAPTLVPEHVTTLRWSSGIELVKRDTWTWPSRKLPVDPTAIDEIVAALRGGSWQRQEPKERAGTIHTTLSATSDDGTTVELGIAEPLTGSDQVWLVSQGRALLVDAWIARALEPSPLALRVKRPFSRAATSDAVTIALVDKAPAARPITVELAGQPRRAGNVLVDVDKLATLERALSELELVADRPPAAVTATPTVALDVSMTDASSGPHTWRVSAVGEASCGIVMTGVLEGCVSRDAWRAVVTAVTTLSAPVGSIVERRPARSPGGTSSIASIKLPAGMIDVTKRATIDGEDADRERVDELVTALNEPAKVVPVPATPASGEIEVHRKDGAVVVVELHDGVVVRRGEPIGLEPTPLAWSRMSRPAAVYRDQTLWIEEPTSIVSLTVDKVTYTAGTQLGTWSRTGDTSATPNPVIDNAVRKLAVVRAPPATLLPAFAVKHVIAIATSPPSGPPVRHVLEIGDRCVARAAARAVVLPDEICKLVTLGR